MLKPLPTITLHTLRAAGLPALAEGAELPKRLVVFPWATHDTRRGKFIVSDLTARVFEANQKKMRLDGRLALDFEHNTLPGTEAYKSSSEPRPIAALALCRVIPGEGLVYEDIEWTPEGKKAIQGGHYQDLSPSPFRDEAGNVIGLHSVALCRHGEVEGLTIHAAASRQVADYLCALSAADITPTDPLPNPTMKDALLKLLKACGIEIAADADEAAVTAALSAASDKMAAKPAEGLSAELNTLRAEMDGLRKENLISRATAEGKVIPLSADDLKITPLSVVENLVKAAKPGQVSTQARTVTGEDPDKNKDKKKDEPEALSAEVLDLGARMGLSEQEIREFGLGEKPAAK